MKELLRKLDRYQPFNEQEARDREQIARFLSDNPNAFSRENLAAHVTASAWIVNAARDRALMAFHNIYRSWSWLGGHADGETDLLRVALGEAREESGLSRVRQVSEEIYSLEILTVDGHEKRGQYVPSHLHLNFTFLLEADEAQSLHAKPDENSAVKWFSLREAVEASREEWMRERIYKKLNQKLAEDPRFFEDRMV